MASESYAIPPRDRAIEGILWFIQSTGLQPGERLPAERELCELIGVSRTALRAAIARLISCGNLESRRGSGTYVCPPKPLNIFQETYNYSDAVRRAGQRPSSRLIDAHMEKASEKLAKKMGLNEGAPVFVLRRVRLVNDVPASIETAFVNASLCSGLEGHDFAIESLYDVLFKEGGVRVEHGREHISISRLNIEEAEFLESDPETPVFFETSIEFDADMRVVEYCKAVVLPTKYRFADNGQPNGAATEVGEEWLRE